jgi:hypothetical protein
MDDIGLLRRRLLGLEGPYADPRCAVDALDNIRVWARTTSESDAARIIEHLLQLTLDDSIEVATGAALALGEWRRLLDCDSVLRHLGSLDERLWRRPTGFAAASQETLWEECFMQLAASSTSLSVSSLDHLLLSVPDPRVRRTLLASLAARYGDLVIYHARAVLNHEDARIIAALPLHRQRIALASSLRPWPQVAIDKVRLLLSYRTAPQLDIDAIVAVMSDRYRQLTCPEGINGNRFWWIIASDPYVWTIWENDSGQLAFESHHPGLGFQSSGRIMTCDEVSQFRRDRKVPGR